MTRAYVDAHVHVWTDNVEKYPLADGYARAEMKPLTFLPEDILCLLYTSDAADE